MWLNEVLTPGKSTPKPNFRTGPSASCGYSCPLCPFGGRYPGKIRLMESQGENGHRRPVPGNLVAVRHGRASQTSGTKPCGDCRRFLW